MFVFNDKVILWVLMPVARGYKAVVPEIARKGVRNFFYNLGMPIRFVNCILQGKGSAAGGELGRFILNTTVGVLGFWESGGRGSESESGCRGFGTHIRQIRYW